jgi:hypothetical protein
MQNPRFAKLFQDVISGLTEYYPALKDPKTAAAAEVAASNAYVNTGTSKEAIQADYIVLRDAVEKRMILAANNSQSESIGANSTESLYSEHQVVSLRSSLEYSGVKLAADTVGTIVAVHPDHAAYTVEFVVGGESLLPDLLHTKIKPASCS